MHDLRRLGVCFGRYPVDPENPRAGGEWGECAPTFELEPCEACGAGGSRQCTAEDLLGPCQPASAVPEACGNGCDDDRDGQADEFCAESETFDYCARNPDGTLTRWRCACGGRILAGGSGLLGQRGCVHGEKIITRSTYDERTGRLKSIIRSGYTETFDTTTGTWSGPVERHVGLFYFNHHKCSGETDTGGSEVLEVHGPCAVSSPSAIDCDQDSGFPITQYDYYEAPSIERSNRANKLRKVSRFLHHGGPNACSGHPALETTYDSYDARGNLLSLTDPRGVRTDFQYVGGRLTEVTAAGLSMRLLYEGTHLTAIRFPAGNHAVRCYRTGTTPGQGCTGGQQTSQLQWVAMAADAAGADWSEKILFTYWPDGAVRTEEYRSRRDGVEETRRKVEYHPDAHQRPTHTRWGVGPGSFAAVGAFDKNGNRTGIALPFNEAPDFCAIDSAGQPLSRLCAALGYDRADRLTHVAEFPAPSIEQHTAFMYDRHGHAASIQTGCASAAGCEQPISTYRYDDFGNLLQVQLPHAAGPVRYGYDARGNLTVKQTEAMRQAGEWLEQRGLGALWRPAWLPAQPSPWRSPRCGVRAGG